MRYLTTKRDWNAQSGDPEAIGNVGTRPGASLIVSSLRNQHDFTEQSALLLHTVGARRF